MIRRAAFAGLLLIACGATQTDPPPRGIGAPNRDAGGTGESNDAGGNGGPPDSGDTTIGVGDDAGADADVDARVDGTECTSSSSIAAPTPPVAGLTLVAYGPIGFSSTQGKCGWSYGYIAPATSTAFVLMTQYNAVNEEWFVQEGTYWTFMNRYTMHPNGLTTSGGRMAIDQYSVRRWTSNYGGIVRITGSVKKAQGALGGTGTAARIMVGSEKKFDQVIIDETGTTFDILATVALDTTIDFIVDPNMSDDGNDSTNFVAAIWK